LQREAGWKDNLVFSEYFYGGSVAGLGAAHRTEPRTRRNGLIAGTVRRSTRIEPLHSHGHAALLPAPASTGSCDGYPRITASHTA